MQVVILINALDHTPRIRNDTSITVIMNYPDSDDRDTQVLGLHYTHIYKYPHIIYAIILTYIEFTMAQVVPQYSIILYITLKHSLLFTFITLPYTLSIVGWNSFFRFSWIRLQAPVRPHSGSPHLPTYFGGRCKAGLYSD